MKKLIGLFVVVCILLGLVTGCSKMNSLKKATDELNKALEELSDELGDELEDVDSDSYQEDEDEDAYEDEDSYEDEDAYEDSGETDDSDEYAGEFLGLFESNDIIETFKEFGYVFNTVYADGGTNSWSFDYVSLGNETIDGVETEHIKITQVENGETKNSECWYNNDWEAVKVITGDTEYTGIDASWYGTTLPMLTQIYSNYLALKTMLYTEDGKLDDFMYEVKEINHESFDLGYGNVDVEMQEINVKIGNINHLIGTTDYDGKKLCVVLESVSKDTEEMEGLRLTRAIAR